MQKFKIVIPSYNNEDWVEYNIASILNQTYTNYEVLYIDDKSTDGTLEKVRSIVGGLSNWTVVSNDINRKRGYNTNPKNPHIQRLMTDPEDILIFVDGDDWLYDENVLHNLNEYYNKHRCWMSYGGFVIYYGDDKEVGYPTTQNTHYSDYVHSQKLYRKDVWRASHLRSFKWWLYSSIKEDDLRYTKDGLHYEYAEDLATSFPCLEMCGKGKIGVVDFLTYVYNQSGEIGARSEERQSNVAACDAEVRNREPYQTALKKREHFIMPKLSGGLGNNLFQIANAYALSKEYDLDLVIDYSLEKAANYKDNTFRPHYVDTIFGAIQNKAQQTLNASVVHEKGFEYEQQAIPVTADVLIEGHYQSYKYFDKYRSEVLNLFKPSADIETYINTKYPHIVDSYNTVGVHIRRGDYLKYSHHHHNLSINYYKNAISYFPSDSTFVIFSDDIAWCKEQFVGENFVFVEGEMDVVDLHLMSKCKHAIISNSTFGWWGAWLISNPNKTVVYPNIWFGPGHAGLNAWDLFPTDWVCLSEELPKMQVNILDNAFGHLTHPSGRYSHVHKRISKHIAYVRGMQNYDGITLFTDDYLLTNAPNVIESGYKIGWLMEAREMNPTHYDRFEDYANNYDFILTHDPILLEKYPGKTKYYPIGGCWIRESNYGLHSKTKNISMIYSNKTMLEGHKLRHEVAGKVGDVVDLFGRGTTRPIELKEDALVDYRYSIVIENTKQDNYITEKIVDCLAVGTIPVYWGCPNLSKFFNMDGIITFDSLENLQNILPTLDEKLYLSKMNAIRENLELSKLYSVTEDWLYNNVFSKLV